MAIRKHAMTKEGAIVSITRNQIGKIDNKKTPKGLSKTFIDLYMQMSDEKIKQAYLSEFEIELEIVK
tara:strand:- start:27 stop:227 length:201 start_codon:yes stop_codon:yes gene_type:complete